MCTIISYHWNMTVLYWGILNPEMVVEAKLGIREVCDDVVAFDCLSFLKHSSDSRAAANLCVISSY